MTEHTHTHPHSHSHSHTHTRAVLNRMARAIGHMNAVRTMMEEGRDCSDVLIQLPPLHYYAALLLMAVGAWLCANDTPLFAHRRTQPPCLNEPQTK